MIGRDEWEPRKKEREKNMIGRDEWETRRKERDDTNRKKSILLKKR